MRDRRYRSNARDERHESGDTTVDIKGTLEIKDIPLELPIEDVTRTVKNIAGADYVLVASGGKTATYQTASDYGAVDCRAVRNGLVAVLNTRDYKSEHPSSGINLFGVTYTEGAPPSPPTDDQSPSDLDDPMRLPY